MGKGGGGPTQTTSTSNTSNIPEYAQPYVETMLGATQNQLYKRDPSGGITGFQPYKAFGGTYDAQGNMTGYDAGKALAGFTPAQQRAQQGIMGMRVPEQYKKAIDATEQAAGQSSMYGNLGAQAGQQAAGQSSMYGNLGAQAGQRAADLSSMYGNLGSQAGQGYANLSGGAGERGAQIGQSLGQMSTDAAAQQAYMNPYLQNALNPQLAEIQRQYDITGTQQQGNATKSGAFGGSREALMAAENQRNAGLAKNLAIGQGYEKAFTNAQEQMKAANQAALTGNQQALSGYNQAGSQAMQGYGMGLTGAGQAGQQAMQGYGMGLTGAGQAGQQAMQGYGMGLTGAAQTGQMAGQLAGLGGQQLAAEQGIYTAQNAVGQQQQQLEQQKINQALQDYANAQQYPIMQLGTMSNMLRGLPMQAQTTQQYQAQANPITQGIGALGAGASLYNATKGAKGGIMSYDVGGSIRAKLEDMPDESLKAQLKSSSSESIKNDIKQILATRNMAGIKQAAQGGVMRFNKGEQVAYRAGLDPYNAEPNFVERNKVPEALRAPDYTVAKEKQLSSQDAAAAEQMKRDVQAQLLAQFPEGTAPAPAIPTNSILAAGPKPVPVPAGPAPASPAPAQKAPAGAAPAPAPKAPVGTAPAPKAPAGPAPDTTTKYPDLMELAEANAKKLGVSLVDPNANKTVEQLYEEERARKDKFLGVNPAIEARKKQMEEKANIADEVKRTQAMRMAEFFAMWGSTPGNTIVAGLNALKNKVPDFIADSKEASKMRREIDKSIAELDQVDYLEKSGDLKGAEAKKLTAVNKAQTWAQDLSKSAVVVELAKLKEAGDINVANIKGGYDLKAAGMNRAGQREGTEIAKANEDYRRTQSDINNSRLKTEYVDMMKLAGREITDKTPESARAKIINAQKELAKMEKSFNDNEKRALERLNSTYKKYGYSVDEGKSEKSGPSKVINLDKI
jgi:uncharacterized protein YeeX (DUF496 family)